MDETGTLLYSGPSTLLYSGPSRGYLVFDFSPG